MLVRGDGKIYAGGKAFIVGGRGHSKLTLVDAIGPAKDVRGAFVSSHAMESDWIVRQQPAGIPLFLAVAAGESASAAPSAAFAHPSLEFKKIQGMHAKVMIVSPTTREEEHELILPSFAADL